jgi:hypothetical protein
MASIEAARWGALLYWENLQPGTGKNPAPNIRHSSLRFLSLTPNAGVVAISVPNRESSISSAKSTKSA